MRALITGGLGFIGSNLADRLLRDGQDVALFDNASRAGVRHNLAWLRQRHGKRARFVEGDVRDFDSLRQAMKHRDTVYHLAAQVAVTTSVSHPLEDFSINARGTLNALEAARRMKPMPWFVFTSTNKVYGGMERVRVVERKTRYEMPGYPHGIPETFPLDFHSPYGCSKGAADQYVRDYYRIYGLPTLVFRMSCVYGPRQFGNEDQGWLAHFVLAAARRGRLVIYGDGKQVRDLLFVDDLVEALVLAPRRRDHAAGKVFNLGGGPTNAISVWAEGGRLVQDSVGSMPRVKFSDWRPGDQRVYISDIRKAARQLGWRPRVSPREGIKRLAAWAEEALDILSRKR